MNEITQILRSGNGDGFDSEALLPLVYNDLVETQMPVCEIAETLGFGDVQHFARYFRSVKGMSPLAYRKAYAANATEERRSQFGDSYPQTGVVARRVRPLELRP